MNVYRLQREFDFIERNQEIACRSSVVRRLRLSGEPE